LRSKPFVEKTIQESDEVKLLKKRYGQLEAQVALLKAKLAAKSDATGEQAVERKDKQARTKLANLLERAVAMIRDKEHAK
jgi:hypothetical protein